MNLKSESVLKDKIFSRKEFIEAVLGESTGGNGQISQ